MSSGAIENVEVACGMPMMMQGAVNEDIARGIDEFMVRQPLGVGAAICPFNFPAMIPFWFMPYAIAAGNTYIIKPSERVPLTMQKLFGLIEQINLPAGVVNMVNGANVAVDALLDHPVSKPSVLSAQQKLPVTSTPVRQPTASVPSARAVPRTRW